MKDSVFLSMAQFAPTHLDRQANAERMALILDEEGSTHGADIVLFPELATTGYVSSHTDANFAARFYEQCEVVPGPTTELLSEVTKQRKTHAVVGVARRHPQIPQLLYNSAVLLGPEGIIGVHDKVHPCLEEKGYFAPGNTADVYETALGRIAMNVCYDVRFPELARVQALRGAEFIVSLWASFVQPGKVPTDTIVHRCSTRAMENALFFAGCNRVGEEQDRVFYGRSAVADPSGEIVVASGGQDEEVIRTSLDGKAIEKQRAYLTIFRDRRPDLYGPIVEPL